MPRTPLALTNWKMTMTVPECVSYVTSLEELAGALLNKMDVILCPPYTALWPMAQILTGKRIQLAAQNMAATIEPARTGEVSAAMLADVGCRWVLLGHSDVRRNLGDDNEVVNRKVHLALEAGLTPVLFVGRRVDSRVPLEFAIERRVTRLLIGCKAEQVASMVMIYSPEAAIGQDAPETPENVTFGCTVMREWLRAQWDYDTAEAARILYSGSVTPDHAADLLTAPDLDGLSATRYGRDPAVFAEIIRQIALAKGV